MCFITFIRVVEQSSFYKLTGFTYQDYFTYLNAFVIELAYGCSDNGEPTVFICLQDVVLYHK